MAELRVPEKLRDLRDDFLDLLRGNREEMQEKDLYYVVAVSSGKAVSQEIPQQIGKRAGWASQQGANFVEVLIENPAQLVMDTDMLVNLADRLNLHYNIHSATSMAYGMAYRVGQGNGYERSHEYTVKLLQECKRFRDELENRTDTIEDDDIPRLYAINGHMAISEIPPEEERMARDVSVDPWGDPISDSKIFESTEARLGIWKYLFWERIGVKDDTQQFQVILQSIEADSVSDFNDYFRDNFIDLLAERNFVTDSLLNLVSTLQETDSVTVTVEIENQETGETEEEEIPVQGQRLLELLFGRQTIQLRDTPSSLDGLKNHTNAMSIAQQLATSNPQAQYQRLPDKTRASRGGVELGKNAADKALHKLGVSVPGVDGLQLERNDWEDMQKEAHRSVRSTDSDAYQDVVNFWENGDNAAKTMKTLVNNRRYQEDFRKESSIFRVLMPLWMPFAEQEPVQNMWNGITDKPFDNHEDLITWLYDPDNQGTDAAMNHPRQEEDVIAAATGAYVWGHFTQTPPGYDTPLVKYLADADMYWSFEAHMAGPAQTTRIWKPKDMVEVVKAINTTPISNGGEMETFDRTRITIDMEHLATQKVDPMWVVDPDKDAQEEGYKGLEDGDGDLIMIQHVTHPYIGEQQHHHGPVRRGDTLVYEYIEALVRKGMCSDPDLPTIVMYEIGGEKAETLYMLRLIMHMIEYGITIEDVTGKSATEIINKDEPDTMKEYLIQKFFGVTDEEMQHEQAIIHENALAPLENMLEYVSPDHTWRGRAALERDNRPETWQQEEYQ